VKIECGIIFLKGLVSAMNFFVMKILSSSEVLCKVFKMISPVMNLVSFIFLSFSCLHVLIFVSPCRDVAPETFRDHLRMRYSLMEEFINLDPVLKETNVSICQSRLKFFKVVLILTPKCPNG